MLSSADSIQITNPACHTLYFSTHQNVIFVSHVRTLKVLISPETKIERRRRIKTLKLFCRAHFFYTVHVIYGQPFIIEASAYFFSMKIATCVESTTVLTANFILKRT